MTFETLFLSAPLKPAALHIPDGFLSTQVAVAGWVLAVVVIAVALRQSREQLGERQIPLLGVMAAFIFAAQAINFPVAGGTSGHLLGGALAAIVLGPWAAVLVMASVIGLQALLFQDGGLLALGWNIVNMGVLTAFTGVLLYRLVRRLLGPSRTSVDHATRLSSGVDHATRPSSGVLVAGVVGAWLSVEVGAIATALQLAVSGTAPLNIVLPAMAGVHALIGAGEALITVGSLLLIAASRPDLLEMGERAPGTRAAGWVAAGLLAALVVAGLSFLASPEPDGLERVAIDTGFIGRALDPLYQLLPDYTIPFIGHETVSGVLAVILGTLVVFALAIGLGWVLRRPRVSQ